MDAAYAETLAAYNAAKREYRQLKRTEERAATHGAPSRGIPPARPLHAAMTTAESERLYLVSRRGPACFVVADAAKRTYSVTIGAMHHCSCRATRSCSHMQWVLSRCLHLDSATARQDGLDEPALSRALEAAAAAAPAPCGRRRPSEPPSTKPALHGDSEHFLLQLSPQDAWLLTQPPIAAAEAARGTGAPSCDPPSASRRKPVEAGDTCAICFEAMDPSARDESEVLTWCEPDTTRAEMGASEARGCGRAIHRHCLRVWAMHQPTEAVSCPMCRAPWRASELWKPRAVEASELWKRTQPSAEALDVELAAREAARLRQQELRAGFEAVALREALNEVAHRRRQSTASDGGDIERAAATSSAVASDVASAVSLAAAANANATRLVVSRRTPATRPAVDVGVRPAAGAQPAAAPPTAVCCPCEPGSGADDLSAPVSGITPARHQGRAPLPAPPLPYSAVMAQLPPPLEQRVAARPSGGQRGGIALPRRALVPRQWATGAGAL